MITNRVDNIQFEWSKFADLFNNYASVAMHPKVDELLYEVKHEKSVLS